jgi:hypothetical protein
VAIRIDPDGTLTNIGENPPLDALQEAVGGYIEAVDTIGPDGKLDGGYIYVNEEGRLQNLEPNLNATLLTGQSIVGPAVHFSKSEMQIDRDEQPLTIDFDSDISVTVGSASDIIRSLEGILGVSIDDDTQPMEEE